MWTRSQFARFILEHERLLIKALTEAFKPDEPSHPDPAPEPPPFKPEPIPPHETEDQRLKRRARDDVRAGRAVDMATMGRAIPKPRPPRAPGMQRLRGNGLWEHY
jgi:hypothetical protein